MLTVSLKDRPSIWVEMSWKSGQTVGHPDPDEEPETFDNQTGKPDPTPDRVKLSTLRDIRLEMSRVYRSVKRGKLEESQATKRVYILAEIGKIITVAELEKRVIELEERHALNNGGRPALPATQH